MCIKKRCEVNLFIVLTSRRKQNVCGTGNAKIERPASASHQSGNAHLVAAVIQLTARITNADRSVFQFWMND
uniref:Uncharacterized protein n=1 Tax=Anopheles dirus TaxID=7168 RepID=A0A182NX08_9DIPT